MTKERIEKLIAKGELKMALDELLAWTKDKAELSEIYNAVISNTGRLAELERKKIKGELDHKEAAQVENQIRNAVLSALGQAPASAWDIGSSSSLPQLSQLRTDPLLLDFVKKHGDAYDHDHALFIDFWEEVRQKYGSVRERDLLAILEEVHQALQEIPQLAMKFVSQHIGKWRTSQWVDFKDGIEEKYGAVMSVKELAALLEEKRKGFEEMLKNFVWIKAGEFMMGAVEGDKGARENEKPQHKVRLSAFYMSKCTITLGQFAEFVETTSYQTDADKKSLIVWGEKEKYNDNWLYNSGQLKKDKQQPVIDVSWNDAVAFCNYWNQKYGFAQTYNAQGELLEPSGNITNNLQQVYGFRLPSEAEWEYACRAGTDTVFYTGNILNNRQANFEVYNNNIIRSVGSFKPNPWGLYDMHGNVWEWCQDAYSSRFYEECQSQSLVENPLNEKNGDDKICRGGSWSEQARRCLSSSRDYCYPSGHLDSLGFRVVLSFQPTTNPSTMPIAPPHQ